MYIIYTHKFAVNDFFVKVIQKEKINQTIKGCIKFKTKTRCQLNLDKKYKRTASLPIQIEIALCSIHYVVV